MTAAPPYPGPGRPILDPVHDPKLDELDVACGMLVGLDPDVRPLPRDRGLKFRAALETCVLRALSRPPCGVSFSGGRDSSTLLALAAKVAAREGLPAPIPVTHVPDHPEAREDEWQKLVLDHLNLEDWQRVRAGPELETLGEISTRFLVRHGLRYPWNTHFHQPLLAKVRGGSMITGAGGDELFSPFHWSRLAHLRRHPGDLRLRDWQHLAGAALPSSVRGRLLVRRNVPPVPWLSAVGRRATDVRVARWIGAQPRDPRSFYRSWWWRSRYLQHGVRSLHLLGSDEDVLVVSPFSDGDVIAAFADERLGYPMASRSDVMCALFSDLLPSAVLERVSKAVFGSLNRGPVTEEFVRTWEPRSVDLDLVDVEVLRTTWRSLEDARSLGVLKQEWLAAVDSKTAIRD